MKLPSVVVPFVLAAPLLAAEDKRPFTVQDLVVMERLSDPQAAPDGSQIAFVVRSTDLEANRGRLDIWMVPVGGGEPRQLTTHPDNDHQPRFAPDGKSLFFLSSRSGSSQVWRLPLAGGEPEQVTHLPLDVDNLHVFPDGKHLLVSLEVWPDAKDPAESKARDDQKAASKVKASIHESLPIRHWDQWEDGKRSHWFVVAVEGGEAIDLMKGLDWDSPLKPFGGAEDAAIAPDGRSVVFAAKETTKEAMWSTDVDLWQVAADGTAAPSCLTTDNQAMDSNPVFSPDGKKLAYLAMKRPGYESDRQGVIVLDLASGQRTELAPAWDRSAGSLAWSHDGSHLLVTAPDTGTTRAFLLDATGGAAPRALTTRGTAGSALALPDGRVALLYNDLKQPSELLVVDPKAGAQPTALTRINAPRLKEIGFGDYEQFSFSGAHGDTVYGYVLKPWNFAAGTTYPVAFLIHGGPQGSFSDNFHFRWNPQIYAGRGYAAVFVDFHGSVGYGQAFTDAIRGDWGGAPYEDLMKGLDAALAKYPFLDGERVAALGASYGGYMINWIAGQTDRFRCLVNHDGNLDERMAYFDTEELWFPEWEHGGTPWDHPEGYVRHNPIDHVAQWKTPMLVIHGALDYRVVDTQGMSTFTALQRLGIPSKFLYFPDENHWVLKPQNSVLWHDTVLDWLDRWTKP